MTSYPPCPKCRNGHLIPLSYQETIYHHWACTNPNCNYRIYTSGALDVKKIG